MKLQVWSKKIGSSVKQFKVGDRVGVGCIVDSCRECQSCKKHYEQFCDQGMVGTYNSRERATKAPTYGGYSTQIVVDENYVLHIPESLPLEKAAPLLCAGITTYSPLKHWNAGKGKKVGVLGLGGLGHTAVKLAKAMGAEVTVLSHSPRKADIAKRLGADHFYSTADENTFKNSKNYFDIILNTASAELNWNEYIPLLNQDGAFVILGVSVAPIAIGSLGLIFRRRALAGSLIGGIKETQEMLDFCAKHNVTPEIEIIPITKVNQAYDTMSKGDVMNRYVIDIGSLKG